MTDTLRLGSTWRRSVAALLEDHGILPRVRGLGWAGDDLQFEVGPRSYSVEAKNTRKIDLAGFIDQAVTNREGRVPFVAIKRRGRSSAAEGYAVLRLGDFMALITEEE